jgi:type VI secretion system protein ImpB
MALGQSVVEFDSRVPVDFTSRHWQIVEGELNELLKILEFLPEKSMSNSLQKWVGRNRPPRVQITYDVEIGNAIEKRELPMVVGLLADLSGQPATPLPKLKERRFVEIDRDNFDDIIGKIRPRLDLSVPDTLKGEGNLKVELNFEKFSDFHPETLVQKVPRLAKLLEARQQLRDLLAKLDGNDELDLLLERIVQNSEELKKVLSQASAGEKGAGSAAEPAAESAAAEDAPSA